MKKKRKFYESPIFWLFVALAFYVVGTVFLDSHEKLEAAAGIISYKTLYLAPILLNFLAMFIGGFVLNDGEVFNNPDQFKYAVFSNCILGSLLVFMTTEETIVPTILFWLGILAAHHGIKIDKPKNISD